MWFLIVAAGIGYLVRCWQNKTKANPVITCLDQSTRTVLTSPPCTLQLSTSSFKCHGVEISDDKSSLPARNSIGKLIYESSEGDLNLPHTFDYDIEDHGYRSLQGATQVQSVNLSYTLTNNKSGFLNMGFLSCKKADCLVRDELTRGMMDSVATSLYDFNFPHYCETGKERDVMDFLYNFAALSIGKSYKTSFYSATGLWELPVLMLLSKKCTASGSLNTGTSQCQFCLGRQCCVTRYPCYWTFKYPKRCNTIVCSASMASDNGVLSNLCNQSIPLEPWMMSELNEFKFCGANICELPESVSELYRGCTGSQVSDHDPHEYVDFNLDEGKRKKMTVTCTSETLNSSGFQKEIVGTISTDVRTDIYVDFKADDSEAKALPGDGRLVQFGMQGKASKYGICQTDLGMPSETVQSDWFKTSPCSFEMGKFVLLQGRRKKIRNKIPMKVKGPQKFLMTKGSSHRKMFLHATLNHASSFATILRRQGLDKSQAEERQTIFDPLVYSKFALEQSSPAFNIFSVNAHSCLDRNVVDGISNLTEKSILLDSVAQQNRDANSAACIMPFQIGEKFNDLMLAPNMDREAEEQSPVFSKAEHALGSFHGIDNDDKCLCSSEGRRLFNSAVGVAIMSVILTSRNEIEQFGRLLEEAEDLIHDLKKQIDTRKEQRSIVSCSKDKGLPQDLRLHVGINSLKKLPEIEVPLNAGFVENDPVEFASEDHDSAESVLTEEHTVNDDCMVEFELELETELERMNVHMQNMGSNRHKRKFSTFGDMDLHSPTVLGCDSRSDKRPTDPASDYAVSPTELEMHLWKVLAQRQEEHLLELEKAHQLAEEKLFAKEKELQRWKEHVRSLTELSLDTTPGCSDKRMSDQIGRWWGT